MTLSPTALEEAARAALLVRARLPGCQDEWPVLSTDPDFDDLPTNGDEGCDDDEITQEAVLRVCAAAITAYLAQAGKEGWVMVPTVPLANLREADKRIRSVPNRGSATAEHLIQIECLLAWPNVQGLLAAAQNGGDLPAPPR